MGVELLTVDEQIRIVQARIEKNKAAATRYSGLLRTRHVYQFAVLQAHGSSATLDTLEEFQDEFDEVILRRIRDLQAQVRQDQANLAEVMKAS